MDREQGLARGERAGGAVLEPAATRQPVRKPGNNQAGRGGPGELAEGMPPLEPPPPVDARDADHLRLVAILNFVAAGLGVAGLLFLFLHFTMMRSAFDPAMWEGHPNPPPLHMLGFLQLIYPVMGCTGGVLVLGNLLSGFWVQRRRNRTFTQVVAALNCLQFPLGTALGVFTLVVLTRPSVRALYALGEEPG